MTVERYEIECATAHVSVGTLQVAVAVRVGNAQTSCKSILLLYYVSIKKCDQFALQPCKSIHRLCLNFSLDKADIKHLVAPSSAAVTSYTIVQNSIIR
jgi:hypothetical protein